MKKKMKIVLLGLGTVGFGVYEMIRNHPILSEEVQITKILVKDIKKKRAIENSSLLTSSTDDLLNETCDVMIETLGGIHPAYELTKRALSLGIHVITSNKELVNTYFYEFLELADKNQCRYLYEASVLAGIPIIKSLHQIILNDQVIGMSGILNGSTNYCLTRIFKDHYTLDQALNEAKQLGFLEADPKDDLEGFDALRKIMILAKIVYQIPILESECSRRGIDSLSDSFISYAQNKGLTLKLIATSTLKNHELSLGVEPVLLRSSNPYAGIDDEMNIIDIETQSNEKMTWTGKGAGMIPTAIGICSDLELIMNHEAYHLVHHSSKNLVISFEQEFSVYLIEMSQNVLPESMIEDQEGLLYQTKKIQKESLHPFIKDIKFYAKVV